VLIVKYQLSSGEAGEDVLVGDAKWTFGRPGSEEPPTVSTDDQRISRNALVIRDSGPGPVVFRGQRGEAARVGLISSDGTTEWLSESKAGHMTDQARRVELHLGDEHVITIEVDFADRGTVKQRQREQAKAEQAANDDAR
jgi:hypothetical protein